MSEDLSKVPTQVPSNDIEIKKFIPTENITLFRSCLVSSEYPGIESSTKYIFDKLGIEYVIDRNQSCCTGLGHYYDIFDEFSTTALAARNFHHAIENNHKHFVPMCSTCYAILKTSAKILNEKDDVREEINRRFREKGLDNLQYTKGDIDPVNDITHVLDVLFYVRDKLPSLKKVDLSGLNIATHHGCHYYKVHYDDSICDVRNPNVIDDVCESMGAPTIGWYDHKRRHCGCGFRQRYANKELSMEASFEKFDSLYDNDVDLLIHMCPNCQVQFDRYQHIISKKTGHDYKMVHLNISQAVALYMGADPYKILGIQTHTQRVEPLLDKLGVKYDIREDKLHD